MTFRGPDDSPAGRFADARMRYDATYERVDAKHRAAVTLASELSIDGRAVDMTVFDKLPETSVTVQDPSTLPPAALATIVSEIESAIGRLAAREAKIEAQTEAMKAKLSGSGETLGPAPRAVPASYVVAELFSLRLLICVVVAVPVGTAVAQLNVGGSQLAPLVLLAVALAVAGLGAASRVRLLARGSLPVSTTVTKEPGIGSYQNAYMRQARRWEIVSVNYSGPSYKSRVRFVALDGSSGEVVVRGLEYIDGVILCGAGGVGRIVSDFASGPRPGPTGAWAGTLTGARTLIVALVAVATVTALVVAVATAAGAASTSPHRTRSHRVR